MHLKEHFYLLLLLLLLLQKADAQDTIRASRTPDSSSYERFDDWFVIKPSIVNTAEALSAKSGNYNIILQPNTSEIIRTYFNYQFISFYFDYLPRSAVTNNDDAEKGRTKLFTLGAGLNHHQWFAEANFSKTRGYYVENTQDFRPEWRDGDPFIQVPDLEVTSYDAAIGYNTNPRLSLRSTVTQTERQLKSAGAFLPRVYLRYYIVNDKTPSAVSNERSRNLQGLLGAGYQYTYVIRHSLYLVGAFTPAFGYIHTSVRNRSDEATFNFTQKGPIYQWDAKFGFGYNGHRYFAGTYLTGTSAKYSQGLTSAENQNVSLFFQVFIGVRLKAPKFISNRYKKVFH